MEVGLKEENNGGWGGGAIYRRAQPAQSHIQGL